MHQVHILYIHVYRVYFLLKKINKNQKKNAKSGKKNSALQQYECTSLYHHLQRKMAQLIQTLNLKKTEIICALLFKVKTRRYRYS